MVKKFVHFHSRAKTVPDGTAKSSWFHSARVNGRVNFDSLSQFQTCMGSENRLTVLGLHSFCVRLFQSD